MFCIQVVLSYLSILTHFSVISVICAICLTACIVIQQARRYTDITKFSLRCLVCSTALTGPADAQAHAKKTGHINFGEI